MNTTLKILQDARALISSPEHWTQGVSLGRRCAANAIGEAGRLSASAVCAASDALASAGSFHSRHELPIFNDSHTHAEVLDLFDKAIAAQVSEAH